MQAEPVCSPLTSERCGKVCFSALVPASPVPLRQHLLSFPDLLMPAQMEGQRVWISPARNWPSKRRFNGAFTGIAASPPRLILAQGRRGRGWNRHTHTHKDAVCNTWQKDLKLDYKLLFQQVNVRGVFYSLSLFISVCRLCLPSVNVNTLF